MPSADTLPATLYGHSSRRPPSRAECNRFARNSVRAFHPGDVPKSALKKRGLKTVLQRDERHFHAFKEAQGFRPGPRESDASTCIRRHHAFALPPSRDRVASTCTSRHQTWPPLKDLLDNSWRALPQACGQRVPATQSGGRGVVAQVENAIIR